MIFDILILCKKQDQNKLKFIIESVNLNLDNFENIYVVSDEEINSKNFINFTDFQVLDKKYKDKISYRPNWIFQQYIKLFQNITKNDKYLVLDADIYINKKLEIFSDGKPNLFLGIDQNHDPYFQFSRNFGIDRFYNHSFISEIMLFDKKYIRNFLDINNLSIESFLQKANSITNDNCYISEFEFYGNLIQKYFPKEYNIKKLNCQRFGKSSEWNDDEINYIIQSNKNYEIVSYHTWL